jgi:hypothetical protein
MHDVKKLPLLDLTKSPCARSSVLPGNTAHGLRGWIYAGFAGDDVGVLWIGSQNALLNDRAGSGNLDSVDKWIFCLNAA